MKSLAIFVLSLLTTVGFAQEPFERDGKWGLSSFGDGDTNDSVWISPVYDKVEEFLFLEGSVYAGIKNKGKHMMSGDSIIDSREYDYFKQDFNFKPHIYAFSEGKCDIIDVAKNIILFENLNANDISNKLMNAHGANEDLITTESGKGMGLFDTKEMKVVIPAIFDKVLPNDNDDSYLIVVNDQKQKGVVKLGGSYLLKFSNNKFTSIEPVDTLKGLYRCYNKKGEQGFFNIVSDYFIAPTYTEVEFDLSCEDCVRVINKNGEGLYYKGKLIIECEYSTIESTYVEGFIAEALTGDLIYYVRKDGSMIEDKELNKELYEE